MPPFNVRRVDLQILLQRDREGGARVRIIGAGEAVETVVSAGTVDAWLALPADEPLPDAASVLGLEAPLRSFLARDRSARSDRRRNRLTLEIDDLNLAALAWETTLAPTIPEDARVSIVRISSVRPRVLSIPLTLPVRILQVDPLDEAPLSPILGLIFGGRSPADFTQAVQVRTCERKEIRNWRPPFSPSEVPTVEVLHFDHPHFSSVVLSTAMPSRAGTLGWFWRLTDLCQSRLVVLRCRPGEETATARRLAAALIARGGPAVLVGDLEEGLDHRLYDRIAHDFPLDDVLLSAQGDRRPSLFGGSGREEALRVSSVGEGLLELKQGYIAASRRHKVSFKRIPWSPPTRIRLGGGDWLPFELSLRTPINDLVDSWRFNSYMFSKSTPLLPFSEQLEDVRREAGIRGPIPAWSTQTNKDTESRYLNASLWRNGSRGRQIKINARRTWLRAAASYHLDLQIGPQGRSVAIFDQTALLEEKIKWSDEGDGAWVEIAVTGIGFDVIGAPVQELWLPRRGPSEQVLFTVVPREAGVSVLRVCLYQDNDLLQSFRLAALTLAPDAGEPGSPPSDRQARRLARSLDLPRERVDGLTYAARMEYSITDLQEVRSRPDRALSIVANDLDGTSVVTLKGPDLFAATVDTNNTLPDHVIAIRKALQEIATPHITDVDSGFWQYGFGSPSQPNSGSEEVLQQALCRMANAGWTLFQQIVPAKDRASLGKLLAPERQILHVAHVLLEKVIPWSLIYDAPYDPDQREDDDRHPVTHTACLAALPAADGSLPATECGQHPDCLLHPDQIEKRRQAGPWMCRETVACPLHFWGFKHIVEIPPQQVKDGTGEANLRDEVTAAGTPRLAAGINATLRLADQHLRKLDDLVTLPKAPAVWVSRSSRRQELLRQLRDRDLDLVYFYCHARGGLADPGIKPPCLEVQEAGASPEQIKPAALQHDEPWSHHPLVILNGCGTVAFSPDALSPFITTLVRDREASGVLGTEIPVWEQLANEVAVEFLGRFLAGRPAGEALLEVRRALLAQHNPLGLVYTLYAVAELRLVRRPALPTGPGG